ncbi:hypothetical protein [Sphaerochaeta sp.]|uniref:hypothetical protein n=1 Tax=Sphaerochaeta sp. TaxID=1972642 RepID=UPI003D0C5B31
MYLEQILEEISVTNKKLTARMAELEKVMNDKLIAPEKEFVTLKELAESGKWPYTLQATRKMIERGKLEERYHFNKIDGKWIFSWPALREYLENKFYSKRCA